jgi:phospholipase/carboxylesterase
VVSEPAQQAQFVVIWMHGLGAGYEDMAGLAQAIAWPNEKIRQIFLQAPDRPVTINAGMRMPAWYDILGGDLVSRQDCEGVHQSSEQINAVVAEQVKRGIRREHIFLAGFSQGGAMALYSGLQLDCKLGGMIALSAYIPCVENLTVQLNKATPVFMGYGQMDPLVQPSWTKQSHDHLMYLGFNNTVLKSYRMEHAVCPEEITDLQNWFSQQMVGVSV